MAVALWMRWLDFRRLRDLFWIVAEHDCALRAKDLTELGVRSGVLVNDKGEPFKPTPIYHYRRTLERLGLLRIREHRYCVAGDNPAVSALLASRLRETELTVAEREAFAMLVLTSRDCYDAFLKAFVSGDLRPFTIEEFLRQAKPVSVHIEPNADHVMTVRLVNTFEGTQLLFSGENAVQAILWGLKPWCVEQLQFLDEVLSVGAGYLLLPRTIEAPGVSIIAEKLMRTLAFKDDWVTVRVEDLIISAAKQWQFPIAAVREALYWLVKRFPGQVAPIPTSEQFVLSGVHPAQGKAALNSYLRLPTGELISHLRVHAGIQKALIRQGVAQ